MIYQSSDKILAFSSDNVLAYEHFKTIGEGEPKENYSICNEFLCYKQSDPNDLR